MVPYKKMPMIVEAFSTMPDKKLVVIGDGPEFEKCKAAAGPNVQLMGWQPFEVLKKHMQQAKAFVFAADKAADKPAADPAVKKSDSGICHDSKSPSCERTKKFTEFKTMEECLKSGGKQPK